MKKNTYVTIFTFLGIILTCVIAGFFTPDKTFSSMENRYLATFPKFSVESLFDGEFSADYEEYITDQFFARDEWIKVKTVTEILLGKKDINGVYISKDNYLIEAQDGIDEEKAYGNADKMSTFLEELSNTLGKDNISIMIAPTATNVLEDKLPAYATTFDQNAYIDYIKTQTGNMFVDVRNVLKENSDEYIYYKTDHHWTTYGAYLAYGEWAYANDLKPYNEEAFSIEKVSEDFYGTIHSKLNYAKEADEIYLYKTKEEVSYELDFNVGMRQTSDLYETEYLEGKDKYSVFLGGNNSIVTIKTVGGDAKRSKEPLLVIKDSYAHCFIPFLTNHYENIVVIDLRYLKMPMTQILDDYGISEVLVMYNAIHFAEDNNFSILKY